MQASSVRESDKAIQQRGALSFLDQIKVEFSGDNCKVFQEFINTMAEFKSNRISMEQLIERITGLFNGHDYLLQQFMQFVPSGYASQNRKNTATPEITTRPSDLIAKV